jgi:hypothetical protein
VIERIFNFVEPLRKVPEMDDENVRDLIAYSYRVIYRVGINESSLLPWYMVRGSFRVH